MTRCTSTTDAPLATRAAASAAMGVVMLRGGAERLKMDVLGHVGRLFVHMSLLKEALSPSRPHPTIPAPSGLAPPGGDVLPR